MWLNAQSVWYHYLRASQQMQLATNITWMPPALMRHTGAIWPQDHHALGLTDVADPSPGVNVFAFGALLFNLSAELQRRHYSITMALMMLLQLTVALILIECWWLA
jgi:hypothetical protein